MARPLPAAKILATKTRRGKGTVLVNEPGIEAPNQKTTDPATSPRWVVSWAAYSACVWAFVFAAPSFYWAAGGTAGMAALSPGIAEMGRDPRFVGTGVGHRRREGPRGYPRPRTRSALGAQGPPLDAARRRLGRGVAAALPRRRLRPPGCARPWWLRRRSGVRSLGDDPLVHFPLGPVFPARRDPLLCRDLALPADFAGRVSCGATAANVLPSMGCGLRLVLGFRAFQLANMFCQPWLRLYVAELLARFVRGWKFAVIGLLRASAPFTTLVPLTLDLQLLCSVLSCISIIILGKSPQRVGISSFDIRRRRLWKLDYLGHRHFLSLTLFAA